MDKDQFYIFLRPKYIYQLFVHDPQFFIYNENLAAIPQMVRYLDARNTKGHYYRLDLANTNTNTNTNENRNTNKSTNTNKIQIQIQIQPGHLKANLAYPTRAIFRRRPSSFCNKPFFDTY